MAKEKRFQEARDQEVREEVKEEAQEQEMTLEEAKAYRASLAKSIPAQDLSEQEKREEFRKYWALNKAKFNQPKEIEPIVWAHLKAVGMDHPSQFDAGIKHFGLKS